MSLEMSRRSVVTLAALAAACTFVPAPEPLGHRSAPAAAALTLPISTTAGFAAAGNLEGGVTWDNDKLTRQKTFQALGAFSAVTAVPTASWASRFYYGAVSLGGYLYLVGGQASGGQPRIALRADQPQRHARGLEHHRPWPDRLQRRDHQRRAGGVETEPSTSVTWAAAITRW